tara:strand:- start:17 stop:211 length:195 start_codon:yes stop_codon:yes gene_type:complete
MLTKKDFTEVANTIISNCKNNNKSEKDIDFIINYFIDTFKKSNPRFDEVRFREFIEMGIYGTVI